MPSRHNPNIHKTPTKFQLGTFHRSERNYASGGWVAQDMWWIVQDMWWVAQDMWWEGCAGYVVVPRTFYSHFVVQLARLQDFKQS